MHPPSVTPRGIDLESAVNHDADDGEVFHQQHIDLQSEKKFWNVGSKCVTTCFLLCSFAALVGAGNVLNTKPLFLTDHGSLWSSKMETTKTARSRFLHHHDEEQEQQSHRDLQVKGLEVLLVDGERIRAGDRFEISSYGDRVYITQQYDGNLVIYRNNKALWATGTNLRNDEYYTFLQKDGNLVTRTSNGRDVWASDSHTDTRESCFFAINTNDAALEIIRGNEFEPTKILWTSETLSELLGEEFNRDVTFDQIMQTDDILMVDERFDFDGGFLTQEKTGRLVLKQYQANGAPEEIWSSVVDPDLPEDKYFTILQGDGNLVTYVRDENFQLVDVWDSNSVKENGYFGNFFLVVARENSNDSPAKNKLVTIHGSLTNPDDTVWEVPIKWTPFLPGSPPPSPFPTPVPPTPVPPTAVNDVKVLLKTDDIIESNKPLYFNGGFLMQEENGSLAIYVKGELTWSTALDESDGYHKTTLQGDGNLVTRNAANEIVWDSDSHTDIHTDYFLVVDAGTAELEIFRGTPTNPKSKIWNSSEGRVAPPPPPPLPPFFESKIKAGPLVGHTTDSSAKIWAFQGQGKTMKLTYKRAGDSSTNTINMPPRSNNNKSALANINQLDASTRYTYELTVDKEKVAQGEFTTAPRRRPIEFQYLLASCINVRQHKGYPDQPVWDHALEKRPDFALLAGDTIYLTEKDWTSGTRTVIYDRVWYRNMQQRDEKHFSRFISNVPTYSAWDDHEYGSNNAERNQNGKENSLKAFKDLWANPGAGTPQVTGTFYTYYWGNVQFLVMDNRWYRWKPEKTQFGESQKQWLYEELERSDAAFKVIVAGCDIMEAGYGKDLDDIGRFVKAKKISGVLFNAGDIHRNEYKEQSNGNWPYPVKQITSSGISRDNWMRPFAMVSVNTKLNDPEITAYFYGANSKDLETTWSNQPNTICSQIEGTNRFLESRCTETIRLSQLQA